MVQQSPPPNTEAQRSVVDMDDHSGLRGFMALWIVVFHALFYAHDPVDIQGSSLMPMFFLLSGFSLTVSYYSKLLGKTAKPLEVSLKAKDDDMIEQEGKPKVTYLQFVVNRLLRVLPVYYICNFVVLPLIFVGFGRISPNMPIFLAKSVITTLIPSSTWLLYTFGVPLNGTAWTVQTLIAVWLFFPLMIQVMHKWTDQGLLSAMRWFYWIQCLMCCPGTLFFMRVIGYWTGFCMGTMSPYSRGWCFAMGVAAGILCLRYKDKESMPWFTDSSWFFPVRSWFSSCWIGKYSAKMFEQTMFSQTYVILAMTIGVSLLDLANRMVYRSRKGIGGTIWFQAVVPYSQMNIMVAMVRHAIIPPTVKSGDSSVVSSPSKVILAKPANSISRFLRHPFMLWMGDLSMSIYLSHFPIAFYTIWAIRGKSRLIWPSHLVVTPLTNNRATCNPIADPNSYECLNAELLETYFKDIDWPQWSMYSLPVLSVIIAWLLYVFIEKPMNKWKF